MEFPKYLMWIEGKGTFLSLAQAAQAYDSGFIKVEFGLYVLNEDFIVRDMTDKDRRKISEVADEYSESK